MPEHHVTSSGVLCTACGYDLSGAALGGACPECGRPVAESLPHVQRPTSGMAITSLVLGILGLVFCGCYGLPTLVLAPMAVIFGHLARRDVRRGLVGGGSEGMAMAGIITGYIGIGLVAAGLIFVAIVAIVENL